MGLFQLIQSVFQSEKTDMTAYILTKFTHIHRIEEIENNNYE